MFLPLPFGSVDEWAIFVFEGATVVLFVLYLGGKQVERSASGSSNKTKSTNHFICGPIFFKILLVIFLGATVIQVIPLPPFLLKIVSPRTFEIYSSLHLDGISEISGSGTAGIGWKTLSFSPNLSVYELTKYICYFFFGFLVYKCVRTKREIENFVLALLGIAIFESFYGLTEYFGGTARIFGWFNKYHAGSAFGTYINRNHFAGFLEMIFPISVGYLLVKADFFAMKKGLSLKQKIVWFGQERLQKSLVFGLTSVLIGIAIFFSRSRSGLMIFFVSIFLMIIALSVGSVASGSGSRSERELAEGHSRERRLRKIVRTIFLAVLFSVIMIGVKPIIERFSLEALTKEGRPVIFKNTIDLIKSFPLFGTGTGTYVFAYMMYEKVYVRAITDHAHNDYLELLAESGLIGGGSLILCAFGALGYVFAGWMRRSDYFVKGIVIGCLTGIAAILIHSITDFNLRIPANAVYFVTLYALAFRTVKKGHF